MPVPDNPLALNMIGWSVISPTLMGLSFMWGARTQWIGNVKKMEGTKDIDHSSPTFRALHPLISHMLYMIGFFNWIWGLTNVGMFLNFPYTVAMAPGFLALAVEIWYMILFQQSPAGGLHGFRGPPVVKRVVITIVAATLAGNAVGVALEKTGPVAEHKGALGVITLFAIAVPQAIAAKLRRDTKLAEKGGKQELLGPE